MAIVKMRKFRLIGMKSEYAGIMRALMTLGCVEITDSAPDDLPRLEPDAVGLSSDCELIGGAVNAILKYYPQKKRAAKAMPDASAELFFGETDYQLAVASEILETARQLELAEATVARESALVASLGQWTQLDLPLDSPGTETTGVLLGSVPQSMKIAQLEREVLSRFPDCKIFPVSEGGGTRRLGVVFLREIEFPLREELLRFGFEFFAPKDVSGTATESLADAKTRLDAAQREREALIRGIDLTQLSGLQIAYDTALTRYECELCRAKMTATERTFMLTGITPAKSEVDLVKALSAFTCAWEFTDFSTAEYAQAPTLLKNSAFSAPLGAMTSGGLLPCYGGYDANALVTVLFTLAYGILTADIVFGAALALLVSVIKLRLQPDGRLRGFLNLLVFGGVSSMLFGALAGGALAGFYVPDYAPVFFLRNVFALTLVALLPGIIRAASSLIRSDAAPPESDGLRILLSVFAFSAQVTLALLGAGIYRFFAVQASNPEIANRAALLAAGTAVHAAVLFLACCTGYRQPQVLRNIEQNLPRGGRAFAPVTIRAKYHNISG